MLGMPAYTSAGLFEFLNTQTEVAFSRQSLFLQSALLIIRTMTVLPCRPNYNYDDVKTIMQQSRV